MLTRPEEDLISPAVFVKVHGAFHFCWCLFVRTVDIDYVLNGDAVVCFNDFYF